MNKKMGVKFNYIFLLLGLLALVLVFFTIMKPDKLWNGNMWASMTMQFPEYGVMTLGVMLCFIAGLHRRILRGAGGSRYHCRQHVHGQDDGKWR